MYQLFYRNFIWEFKSFFKKTIALKVFLFMLCMAPKFVNAESLIYNFKHDVYSLTGSSAAFMGANSAIPGGDAASLLLRNPAQIGFLRSLLAGTGGNAFANAHVLWRDKNIRLWEAGAIDVSSSAAIGGGVLYRESTKATGERIQRVVIGLSDGLFVERPQNNVVWIGVGGDWLRSSLFPKNNVWRLRLGALGRLGDSFFVGAQAEGFWNAAPSQTVYGLGVGYYGGGVLTFAADMSWDYRLQPSLFALGGSVTFLQALDIILGSCYEITPREWRFGGGLSYRYKLWRVLYTMQQYKAYSKDFIYSVGIGIDLTSFVQTSSEKNVGDFDNAP